MDWIKIPTDSILYSEFKDSELVIIIKYQALYCQLEKEPSDAQLNRIFNKKELKWIQSYKEVVQELCESQINSVAKKRNRDKENYKQKQSIKKNSASGTETKRERTVVTDKIREDKSIKENNNLKVITKEKLSFDDTQIDLEEAIKKAKRFVKPTIEDITSYCREKNKSVDAERFWNFYESKGWKVGKNPMKDWRAAVCNWAKDSTPIAQESYQPVVDHEKLKQATSIAELTKQKLMQQAKQRYGA